MASYFTKYRDRLDRICFVHYGSTDYRVVEKVLEYNPGLEEHGIQLPPGITIEFPPPLPSDSKPNVGKQIFLWN